MLGLGIALGLLGGFIFGVVYQNSRAAKKVLEVRLECSKHLAESYAEGYKAAAPRHDPDTGRFAKKL